MRNPDPANWGKWSLFPQPELWQAVCLSMNFEPPKSCDVVEFLRLDQKTFKDRMQVCMANLGGKLTAVDTHIHHFSPKAARVNLATFAAVVSKWGWSIPQQLQALEQHAPKFEAWPLKPEPQPVPTKAGPPDDAWKEEARAQARTIIERQAAKDLHPNLVVIADEIAKEWRKLEKFGPKGTPLSGAYIKRHALQGCGIAIDREAIISTSKGRGK
jgi:hypothetical protein